MKKLKILMIGTTDNIGGAARVGWDLGKTLITLGHEVKYIVAYNRTRSHNVYELRKNPFTNWLDNQTPYSVTSLSRHLLAFVSANDIDWGVSEEILNHPWYKDCQLVHLHNLHGNYFKLETLKTICAQKNVVWTMHDLWPITAHCAYCYDCGSWKKGKHHTFAWGKYGNMLWDNSDYLWNKKRGIYDKCKLTLVSSSAWLDRYVKKSILSKKPSTVALNAVDTSIFKPASQKPIRKQLGLPQDKKIVAYINQGGKDDPRKGGYYFFKAANFMESDESVVFLCVGGGKKKYQQGNIIYIPFVSAAEKLAKYYQAADLFLFTSLADNCPLVPLEAMACGLPVISFDVGGVKEEIVHGLNGYIVKYKNITDLVAGLNWALSLPDSVRKKMVRENRVRAVKYFSLPVMAREYLRVYNRFRV